MVMDRDRDSDRDGAGGQGSGSGRWPGTLTDEQVARIRGLERDGRIEAATVLDDARDPSSPLHPLFEWDIERAAYEHNLSQARRIIRVVVYHVQTKTFEVRVPAYVKDPGRPANRPGYRRLDVLAADGFGAPTMRDELRRALYAVQRVARVALGVGDAETVSMLDQAMAMMSERITALSAEAESASGDGQVA